LNAAKTRTNSSADAVSGQPTHSFLLKPAVFWFAFAVLAVVVLYARVLRLSFDGDFQGWASASCMTMAQSFNQLGAVHTHFVPIQNNLPLGSDPDVYLHWPPLFPFLLSIVIRVLGERESSGRLFALAITLATSGVVVAIARRLYGTRTGLLAGFFFLTARATFEGGRAVLHQPLAILFGSASVFFFLLAIDVPSSAAQQSPLRKGLFAALGLLATICTVLTAWDPVFIPLGLLLSSIYLRRRDAIRLAAVYLSAGVATFFAVQADYIFSYPALFKNQFATIAYRAGIRFNVESSSSLHTIVDRVHYGLNQLSFLGTYSHILRWISQDFGEFVLLAAFLFFAFWLQSNRRQNAADVYVIGGLCLPWLFFYAVMRNYVAIHPFALVLGAPFLAIAAGVVLDRTWELLNTTGGPIAGDRRYILAVVTVALPLLTVYPLLTSIRDAKLPYEPPQFQNFSAVIENNTPPNAVTLSATESAVPIYYSDRHIVRGIESPELLHLAIPQARAAFPDSPLYFALQDADRTQFTGALPNFTVVARQGDSTLYAIP
jgi:hypothetical protein